MGGGGLGGGGGGGGGASSVWRSFRRGEGGVCRYPLPLSFVVQRGGKLTLLLRVVWCRHPPTHHREQWIVPPLGGGGVARMHVSFPRRRIPPQTTDHPPPPLPPSPPRGLSLPRTKSKHPPHPIPSIPRRRSGIEARDAGPADAAIPPPPPKTLYRQPSGGREADGARGSARVGDEADLPPGETRRRGGWCRVPSEPVMRAVGGGMEWSEEAKVDPPGAWPTGYGPGQVRDSPKTASTGPDPRSA